MLILVDRFQMCYYEYHFQRQRQIQLKWYEQECNAKIFMISTNIDYGKNSNYYHQTKTGLEMNPNIIMKNSYYDNRKNYYDKEEVKQNFDYNYTPKFKIIRDNNLNRKQYEKNQNNSNFDERLYEEIKHFIDNEREKTTMLFNKLITKNIANSLIFIKQENKIIGIKIIRAQHLFLENYLESQENWIPVWHGTKFESLESIMKVGLKLPGTVLPDGKKIEPLSGHIKRYVNVNNDKDWAKGIFVSQSIFYAACDVYGRIIKIGDTEWITLIEGRAKIGSYITRGSTVSDYKKVEREPDDVEFKITNESDLVVVGILFLNKKYIEKIKDYEKGSIFVSSNEEIFHTNQKSNNIKGNYYNMKKSDFCYYNPIQINRYNHNIKPMKKKGFKVQKGQGLRVPPEYKYKNHELIINSTKYYWKCFEKKLIYIDSKILANNIVYLEKLKRWLQKPNDNLEMKNITNILLIYRGSRDGFKSSVFHELCDKKGETLVIIKSTDNYIFGGYTSISWDSTKWNGKIGKENNARRDGKGLEFVFTLKNPYDIPPNKFNMKKNWLDHSICCDVNLGPIFGCNDIRIENDCDINSNSFKYYDFTPGEYCFDDTTGKKRMLFTGNSSYKVEEIEVFKIIDENNELSPVQQLIRKSYVYDYDDSDEDVDYINYDEDYY